MRAPPFVFVSPEEPAMAERIVWSAPPVSMLPVVNVMVLLTMVKELVVKMSAAAVRFVLRAMPPDVPMKIAVALVALGHGISALARASYQLVSDGFQAPEPPKFAPVPALLPARLPSPSQ